MPGSRCLVAWIYRHEHVGLQRDVCSSEGNMALWIGPACQAFRADPRRRPAWLAMLLWHTALG